MPKIIQYPGSVGHWDSGTTNVLPQAWGTRPDAQMPRARPRQDGRHLEHGWDSATTFVLPQVWLTLPDRRVERSRRELLAGAIWITDQSVQAPPAPDIDWAALTREVPRRAAPRQAGLQVGWDSFVTAVLPQVWITLHDRQVSPARPRQTGLSTGWDSLTAPVVAAVPDINWPVVPDRRIERSRRDVISGPLWTDSSATAVYPAIHTTLPEKATLRPPRRHDGPLYTPEVSVAPPAAADAWSTLPDGRTERLRRDVLAGPLWTDHRATAVLPQVWQTMPDRQQPLSRARQQSPLVGWDSLIAPIFGATPRTGGTVTSGGGSVGDAAAHGAEIAAIARAGENAAQPR